MNNILSDPLSHIAMPCSTVDIDSPSLLGILSSLEVEPNWLVKVH